jgi:hypothetical protein
VKACFASHAFFRESTGVNARQIVQFHRNSAASAAAPLLFADLTLAAAIEHLVWQTAYSDNAHSGSDGLWAALQATRWPAPNHRDVVEGNLGIIMLPHHYELRWLRNVESDLRRLITNIGFTPMTAKAITGAVSEIINNVWEHAQATSPALLAYNLEPARVNIGIADLGVGVLASLHSNPRYASLATSMAALKKAMMVGVSRCEEAGRGYGFDVVLRAIADQWGAVRLRTGQAILEFHGATDLRHATASYGVDLPGLQVAFTCATNPTPAPIDL